MPPGVSGVLRSLHILHIGRIRYAPWCFGGPTELVYSSYREDRLCPLVFRGPTQLACSAYREVRLCPFLVLLGMINQ